MLSIIVAFPKLDDANKIKNILVRNGYEVALSCNNAAQIISLCGKLEEGIIICGYKLADMMYTELFGYLPGGFSMILLASAKRLVECYEPDIIKLAMPLKINELAVAINNVYHAYKRQKKFSKPKERTEEEKKIINDAKTLLISNQGMSEEEAHRYIQKISMDSGNSMVETAEMILILK